MCWPNSIRQAAVLFSFSLGGFCCSLGGVICVVARLGVLLVVFVYRLLSGARKGWLASPISRFRGRWVVKLMRWALGLFFVVCRFSFRREFSAHSCLRWGMGSA